MEQSVTKRQNIGSGAKWEDRVGYSRAVRIGNLIEVSGTVAVSDGGTVIMAKGNAYQQARHIFEKVRRLLENKLGASINDVVRTRMYIVNMEDADEVGRAHRDAFNSVRPATSLVAVKALIDPDALVEIEFTAVVGQKKEPTEIYF